MPRANMTARENSAQDRRVSSFRIDDILATPSESRRTETQHAANADPSSSEPAQLSFGVDQLLASSREPETRNQLPCYGPCDHYPSTYWSPALYTTTAYGCSPLSGCETCYNHASYPYLATVGYAGIYDYDRTALSKVHIASSVLPNQQKPRKPRRPWTRAVFSNLQRKGLEKRFQVQKYLTKADRHQLASMLGLSDNQVKVWFQNRRMKWRQDARETVAGTGEGKADSNSTVL